MSYGGTNEGGKKYVLEVLSPWWPDLGSSFPRFLTLSFGGTVPASRRGQAATRDQQSDVPAAASMGVAMPLCLNSVPSLPLFNLV